LADTDIVALAVRVLRDMGHDVVYVAERASDPGDSALLAEASKDGRIFVGKDRDVGALVHRDSRSHCGVFLLDDLGSAVEEAESIVSTFGTHGQQLAAGAFVRAGYGGIRQSQ
jgi:predicted nuclease of predicted toxin-antitoxin system